MGLVKANRGDGRGDVKGDAVEDFWREKAAGVTKLCVEAGLAPAREGDASGVEARGICHGAGEPRLIRWAFRAGGEAAAGGLEASL